MKLSSSRDYIISNKFKKSLLFFPLSAKPNHSCYEIERVASKA